MIARFRAALPFTMLVRESDQLNPIEYQGGEYLVRIYAPFKSAVPPGGLGAVFLFRCLDSRPTSFNSKSSGSRHGNHRWRPYSSRRCDSDRFC